MNKVTTHTSGPFYTFTIHNETNSSCHLWLQLAVPAKNCATVIQQALNELPPKEPLETWPEAVGKIIDEKLRNLDNKDKFHTLFAAAAVTPDKVHVATAGDIRLHIIKDNAALHVSTDHTLANDLDKAHIREQMENPEMAHQIVTAHLGAQTPAPINTFTRAPERPYKLIACSNEIHRGQAVKDYLDDLLSAPSSMANKFSGLLAIVDVTS